MDHTRLRVKREHTRTHILYIVIQTWRYVVQTREEEISTQMIWSSNTRIMKSNKNTDAHIPGIISCMHEILDLDRPTYG